MRTLSVLLLLAIAALAAVQAKSPTCKGKKGGAFEDFMGKSNDVHFPCKYFALQNQRCGKWNINFTPGQVWLATNYYIDTHWIFVKDMETEKEWDGRTTNKMIVKYFNEDGARNLFNPKKGELFDKDLFVTGFVKGGKPTVYFQDNDETFRFSFTPFDPDSKKYAHPTWEFVCNHDDDSQYTQEFPAQLCGGLNKKNGTIEHVAEAMFYKKGHKENAIYHHVFMSNVTQMDEHCIDAAKLVKDCPGDRRETVIRNCAPILHNKKDTQCVTYFTCTPMDAFNACLRWGCSGEEAFDRKERDLCYAVGDGIDLCGKIVGEGNITGRLLDANCYRDYLPINYSD